MVRRARAAGLGVSGRLSIGLFTRVGERVEGVGMRFGGLNRASVSLGKSAVLPVAIDFGTSSLKMLQVHRGDALTLVSAAELPTPDALLGDAEKRFAYQCEQLPKLIKSAGFKGKRAVCALPAPRTICKQMQINKPDGVSLIDLIKATLPQQLGCHPDALVYRPIEVGQVSPGKTEVACLAAPHELVQRLMHTLRAAKLEPVGMHSEYIALAHAFEGAPLPGAVERAPEEAASDEAAESKDKKAAKGAPEPDPTTMYVDIGTGATKVVIAHGQTPAFARLIELGGSRMDRVVSEQLDMTMAEAQRTRRSLDTMVPAANATTESGGVAVRTRTANLSEPMEILVDELSMCLRYHSSVHPGRKVDSAVFLGGESTHVAMCAHIARSLRLKAHSADPLARVSRTGKEKVPGTDLLRASPGWAVPLGLSLAPTDI